MNSFYEFTFGAVAKFLDILKVCMNLHEFISVHFPKISVMLGIACTVYDR